MSRLVAAGAAARTGRTLRRDLRTLATFVRVYCHSQHRAAERVPVELRTIELAALCGRPVELCRVCRKLLQHAVVMRLRCPHNPKPICRKCPTHCYAPEYRAQIRAVMRYAGIRLMLKGRLHYALHLFT